MKKFVPLTDQEWVLKAASKDKARSVLTAVNVDDFACVATDGHRLHCVARIYANGDSMQKGMWYADRPGLLLNGTYPNYWQVVGGVTVKGRLNKIDSFAAMPVLKAAVAYAKERGTREAHVSLPITDSPMDGHNRPVAVYGRVNAQYLADVLAGRENEDVLYVANGSLSPILFLVSSYRRVALLMPIRGPEEGKPEARFDLTEYTSAWDHGVPEVVLPVAEKATPGGSSGKKRISRPAKPTKKKSRAS